MRIDPADVGDADILAEMWVDLASEQRAYGTHLRPDANRSRIREDLLRRIITGNVFVARGDVEGSGGIAGFVSFGVQTRSYEQDHERGVIYNLFVRPGYRDQGIGHDLVAAAEEAMVADGVEVVSLEAMADNHDARRFYQRHGYELHRVELEKRIDAEAEDDASDADGG